MKRTVHKIWSYDEDCSQNMKLLWGLFTKYEAVMRTVCTIWSCDEGFSQNMKLWWELFTQYEVVMRTVYTIWSCDEDCSQNMKLWWELFTQYEVVMRAVHKIWSCDEICLHNMKLWWGLFTKYEVIMRTVHKIWSCDENCSQNMKLWWELFTQYDEDCSHYIKLFLGFCGVFVTILWDIPFICLVWGISPLPPLTDSQCLENNPTEQIKTELSNLLENFFNVLNSTWGDFFQDNTPGQLEKLNTSH